MTSFTLSRAPLTNGPREVIVARVEDLTPTYRRIRLAGDFSTFDSLGCDDHLRIFFVPEDFEPEPVDPADPMAAFAKMREHPSREYTPVAWTDLELTLDFVIHGDGPASTWAAEAVPGRKAAIGGPRGSMVIDGHPEWWLLAGDRTALPAIRRFTSLVEPGVPVDVVVITEDPADEQPIVSRGDLTVTWVRSLDALLAAVGELPVRGGEGFAFIAAEQAVVKPGRELLQSRGVDLERAVVKGYWKRGDAS